MFLVRTAFWVGLVVLLLPTDRQQQELLSSFAQQKLHWAMTYCDREPVACERAGETWALFLKKAEYGATLAADLLRQGTSGKPSGTGEGAYAG
jgi:hypothetical protein